MAAGDTHAEDGHWILCVTFSIQPAFADEFVRISYAASMDRIREGIARIDRALRALD